MAPLFHFEKFLQFLALTIFFLFLFHSARTDISVSSTSSPNSAHIICPQQSYSEPVLHMCGSRATENKSRIQRCFLAPPMPPQSFSSPPFSPIIISPQVQFSEFLGRGDLVLVGAFEFFFSSGLPHHLNYVSLYLVSGQYGNSLQLLFYEHRSSLKNLCVLVPPILLYVQGIELS